MGIGVIGDWGNLGNEVILVIGDYGNFWMETIRQLRIK